MSSRKSFPLSSISLALTTLVFSAVCAAQTAAAPEASASETQTVKMGLDARTRYEGSFEKNLSDRVDFLSTRIRPSFSYLVSPKATVYLQAQYAKVFGLGTYIPSGTAANGFSETSGNSSYSDDELRVHQAYFDLKFTENLQFVGGRQELVYGDQYILAASSWGLYGRSFDAAKLRYSEGKSFVDLIHSVLAKTSSSDDKNGTDKSLSGVYASWNVNDTFKAVDLYHFSVADNRKSTAPGTPTTADQSYGVNGARIATQFGDFGLKAEYAQNFGAKGSNFLADTDGAYMSVIELGYTISEESKSRIALELFSAGKNWTEIYPTTHAVLGITDVLGRRNLTGAGLHYSSDVTENWNLIADAYMFQRTNTDNPAYGTDSKKTVGNIASSTSKDIGMELDLRAKYKIDKALSFSLGYGVFQTATFLKDSVGESKMPTYGFAMFEAKL